MNDFKNTIILKNEKTLVVREALEKDVSSMIKYFNTVGGESNNLLFGKDEFPLTEEQEIAHVKNTKESKKDIILLGIIDNEIVSVAQLISFKRKRIEHNSQLSISVKKKYWNNGIASLVLKEIINFAKLNPSIKNIDLSVSKDNIYAIKLYEKFGFNKVGIRKNSVCVNGNFYDEVLMDLNL